MSETALARAEGDALSTIVGTGDTRAALAVLERNVRDVIEVCRARGFVTTFTEGGKRREFYGFPAWQVLAMTYGVTPVVEWTQPIDGGWKARAVAQTRDGAIVGAAEAVCLRKEPKKERATDHTLLAMASTRAQRNALRSAFGAALVLAGFDFPDPDRPATRDQVKALHALEHELGLTHEEGHAEAGVDSYNDLTRAEASELLESWQERRTSDEGRGERPDSATGAGSGEAPARDLGKVTVADPDPAPTNDEPATDTEWSRAPKDMTRVGAIKLAARLIDEGRMPGPVPRSQADFTKGQLAKVAGAWRDGERG